MECDGVGNKREMVAGLQSRRETLESKLREKNVELKALCIQEAELTGALPPETPIEPGESPPSFRRRVGTVFTYPENLINKLKSKEGESFATLELECKIQNGIAEAALGLANDGTASKSVRRKHRLMYQQSQRRLMELETRLSFMRQTTHNNNNNNNTTSNTSASNIINNNINTNSSTANCNNNNNNNNNNAGGISNCSSNNNSNNNNGKSQLKQRKKPRPPLDSDGDCCDGVDNGNNTNQVQQHHHQPLSFSVSDRSTLRHSHSYNNSQRYYDPHQHQLHRQVVRTHVNPYTWQYHTSTSPDIRSGTSLAHDDRDQAYYPAGDPVWYHTAPNLSRMHHNNSGHGHNNNEEERPISNFRYKDRFGSLDRRRSGSGSSGTSWLNEDGYEERERHVKPLMSDSVPAILLPNQTYPENSLMRTLSLGLVDHTAVRKTREKEWYETALDGHSGPAAPSPPLTALTTSPTPPPLPPAPSTNHQMVLSQQNQEPNIDVAVEHRPATSQVNFDTVVPFESPKNHTVVQAGKWQPYREVTKPFEMADFYKYSTKFRKNNSSNSTNNSNNLVNSSNSDNSGSDNTPQHKGVYLPLQPMTCQPLLQNSSPPPAIPSKERRELPNANASNHQSQSPHPVLPLSPPGYPGPSTSLADAFSSEMLAWYQDKNVNQSRSATLV